jgi:hemerythrin-like domain-containing protein
MVNSRHRRSDGLSQRLLDAPDLAVETAFMKRLEALRRLSSEHHVGLVIARRAREALDDPQVAWAQIRQRFVDELEPHFRLEEQGLLPAMRDAGEQSMVERTLAEHRAMRGLIDAGDPENLAAFAQLLADHIRFEESELFETAQRVLGQPALEAIRSLHDQGDGLSCRAQGVARKSRG